MMFFHKLFEYIKLVIFVGAILVGIQVPGFVDQYGKNLTARVSESEHSIAAFQADADKYFAGDLTRLLDHYQRQADPVIIAGGASIGSLVARNVLLTQALQSFNQSIHSPYMQVFLQPVKEIRTEVWQNYNYTVVLNVDSIVIGILVAILLLALFEMSLFSCAVVCKKCLNLNNKKGAKKPLHQH
ncbi:MAG: DUF2937 family protein [Thalassotalea sp.]